MILLAGLPCSGAPSRLLSVCAAILASVLITAIEFRAIGLEFLPIIPDYQLAAHPRVGFSWSFFEFVRRLALTAELAGLTRQRPVLMIVEDAHWVDPTSLEVFGRTVEQIKTLPALLIVTFRPEFNAPWAGRSHVTSLTLNRLGERETAAIIARLVGNKE
jgi:predicted ATPase